MKTLPTLARILNEGDCLLAPVHRSTQRVVVVEREEWEWKKAVGE